MKPRMAFSPKNGVLGGGHDGLETYTRSRNSKQSKFIQRKKKIRRGSRVRRLSSKTAARASKTRSKKQGKNSAKKSQCHEDLVAQEVVDHQSRPFCDKIERKDSDPIPAGEIFTQPPSSAAGGLADVQRSTVACSVEEPVAEEIATVIILAEVLRLLESVCLRSTHFIFTANSISLKISDGSLDSMIILQPLNEISSFSAYACEQESYVILEIGLTESGAEAVKQQLEKNPLFTEYDLLNCKGCYIMAKIGSFDWPEQKIQIISLSNAYKSLWRPPSMEIHAGQVSGSSFPRTDCLWTMIDKESYAEEVTEVIVNADVLLLSETSYECSAQFGFTADTISLSISEGHLKFIKWPLDEINRIASFYTQESCVLLELGFTDSGAEALKGTVKKTPLYFQDDISMCSYNSLIARLIGDDWTERQQQIIALSESYKSLWRPLDVEIFAEQDVNDFLRLESGLVPNNPYRQDFEREDLIDSGEEGPNVHEGSEYQAEEGRHEARLHGWFDIIYPKEDHDAVTVTEHDFLLLNPEEFISDTIIDFYIKYLQSTLIEEDKKRFYFFNSFFFRKLTEVDRNLLYGCDGQKSTFERVKRWTMKINIFEKEYLFIPIMESAHWSLIVVCNPGHTSAECEEAINCRAPTILHLDSLEGCHTGLEEPIRNYLMEAWTHGNPCKCQILPCKCKRFSDVKFVSAQVPQQTNYSDCGLFLLHYVELFIREVLAGNFIQYVTGDWFDPIEASNKRVDIQNLILKLRTKEIDERGISFKCLDFQDCLAYSGNNGGVSTNSAFLLQEAVTIRNREQGYITADSERINVLHNTPVQQMDEAIYSASSDCSNHMSMDIFNRHNDSSAGVDLYSCQYPHIGSYKQLFMLCHSGGKFFSNYAREEDFSASEPVFSNPIPEDNMTQNTNSGHVCLVSNIPCHIDMHDTVSAPQQMCMVDLGSASKEMTTREMCRDSTVDDKSNQLPVTGKQIFSNTDVGMENIESSKTDIVNDMENSKSFYNAEIEGPHPSVCKESTFKDSKPPSISSTKNLTTTVCSMEIEAKDEIFTDKNHKKNECAYEEDTYRVPTNEDTITIHKDLLPLQQEHMSFKSPDRAHDKDQRASQSVLRLCDTLDGLSHAGQSTLDHQAQPGIHVKTMPRGVEVDGSKEDRPTSISSLQQLSTSICSSKAMSTDKICTRNQKEDKSLSDNKVTCSEHVISINKDLGILSEEHRHCEDSDRVHSDNYLNNSQSYLKPESIQCAQSDAGQCTSDQQAQSGVEIENISEFAKLSKPNCREKLVDSEMLGVAGQRPITRSATRGNKSVKMTVARKGIKRKSVGEVK